ncbi:MAG: hypothetical protein LBU88_00580 [Treponema sp.]|jgi:hypothetical protein|nr:hypothetical protein [Treponema sp.]
MDKEKNLNKGSKLAETLSFGRFKFEIKDDIERGIAADFVKVCGTACGAECFICGCVLSVDVVFAAGAAAFF